MHSRRTFLKRAATTAGVGAAFAISGTKASGRIVGANDRVRVAVAGINGRGRSFLSGFRGMKDVEIAYLVDPDSRLFSSRRDYVSKEADYTPTCVQDVREALDDKELDAIAIVTPNHWHALMAIWACQAGKDAYVEKPCSHNLFEGRQLVAAARKYDRLVQHGTQRRSDPKWVQLTSDVRNGKYGKLQTAYAYDCRPRPSNGIVQPEAPPSELDFNMYLGPAPEQDYRSNLVHYRWHWRWDFGNGEIGNLGSHDLDVCRWAMPEGATPKSVVSLGGRFGYKDQGQTPNTHLTLFDFGDVKLVHQARGLVKKEAWKITVEYHTDEGVVRDGRFFANGAGEGIPIENPPLLNAPEQGPTHMRNFIDCVKSRKRDDLTAEIIEGHRTVSLVHLGNTAYRLGRDVSFDEATKVISGNSLLSESFEDIKRHLADTGAVDLSNTPCRLSEEIAYDAEAEAFPDSPEANALRSRAYRAPFIVPEQV
jgi:predicted dehydrogenase